MAELVRDRVYIRWLFQPRDVWVGVRWTRTRMYEGRHMWTFFLCLLPLIPIYVEVWTGEMKPHA